MRSPPVLLLRVAALAALTFTAATALEYYVGGHTFCQPAGGCDQVRYSVVGHLIAPFLPAMGLIVFPLLFVGSLSTHRGTLRWSAWLAVAAGVGGLGFLALQGLVIGHWCWLCVGVDSASVAAGAAGGWMLRVRPGTEEGTSGLASYWWPLFFVAFSPLAYGLTSPDPALPEAITELWDADADLNVVEMADFECPYCRLMHPVLKGVLEDAPGTVHLTRIIVPLTFHVRARPAAAAYFCADAVGQGDAMADRLFGGELDDAALREHAAALGLDAAEFEACLGADATDVRIEQDLERSQDAMMQGLPTVYIGERMVLGFREANGATPYEDAVRAALAHEGRRTRFWPFGLLALLSVLSLAGTFLGRRREHAQVVDSPPEF